MAHPLISRAGTSDTSTNVIQVQRTFNGFGQLTVEKQENDGVVDGSTLEVQFGYMVE